MDPGVEVRVKEEKVPIGCGESKVSCRCDGGILAIGLNCRAGACYDRGVS